MVCFYFRKVYAVYNEIEDFIGFLKITRSLLNIKMAAAIGLLDVRIFIIGSL